MTAIASESVRFSDVIAHEYGSNVAFCREVITAYEASEVDYVVGTVLGKYLVSGSASAVAGGSNTGNGTMGSITVSAWAVPGVYTLRITAASSGAGAFELLNEAGVKVGSGNVASAFVGAGLAFTLADGTPDFAAGDVFYITVTGTEKWKRVESTALDGTQIARAIYIGGITPSTAYNTSTIAATTNTSVLAIVRGPVLYKKEGLVFGASVNTDGEKNAAYAQLASAGMLGVTRIGSFPVVA